MREITITTPLDLNEVSNMQNNIITQKDEQIKSKKGGMYLSGMTGFALFLNIVLILSFHYQQYNTVFFDEEYITNFFIFAVIINVVICVISSSFYCDIKDLERVDTDIFVSGTKKECFVNKAVEMQDLPLALFLKEVYCQQRELTIFENEFLEKYIYETEKNNSYQQTLQKLEQICEAQNN